MWFVAPVVSRALVMREVRPARAGPGHGSAVACDEWMGRPPTGTPPRPGVCTTVRIGRWARFLSSITSGPVVPSASGPPPDRPVRLATWPPPRAVTCTPHHDYRPRSFPTNLLPLPRPLVTSSPACGSSSSPRNSVRESPTVPSTWSGEATTRPWEAQHSAGFQRRLGKRAAEVGDSRTTGDCPEIWELDNGDIAVIGRDATDAYADRASHTASP